jgi:hypothetical protein
VNSVECSIASGSWNGIPRFAFASTTILRCVPSQSLSLVRQTTTLRLSSRLVSASRTPILLEFQRGR